MLVLRPPKHVTGIQSIRPGHYLDGRIDDDGFFVLEFVAVFLGQAGAACDDKYAFADPYPKGMSPVFISICVLKAICS